MFDLKLTDIFSTICIGILTLSLLLYFYFIFNKFFVKDKFDDEAFLTWIKSILEENYKESGYAILALVIIYCAGIIAGDLTERMSDSNDTDKNVVLKELRWFSQMKPQEDAREEVMLSKDYKLTGLGESVLHTRIIVKSSNKLIGSNFFADTSKDVNLQLAGLKDSLRNDSAKEILFNRFIQQIYYSGKNWCYSKNNEPLNEMKSIQSRIDLAKSMVLLISLSIQILMAIVLSNALVLLIANLKKLRRFASKNSFDKFLSLSQIGVFIVMFLILLIANECYDINESNYNKRAYGYYVSYIQQLYIDKLLKVK